MNNAPIGVFDSGLGGLTVARAIIDQLPGEEILYIGDTLNTPYGTKPIGQVRELALAVMDKLAVSGVKMLVIACNSASSAVLADARQRYQVDAHLPVVEVIRPASRKALSSTRNRKIGVIATQATVDSGAYQDALSIAPGIEVFTQACPEFVSLVERGITTGPQALEVAREYLEPMRQAGVDTLVLGCTHYPLLSGVISYVMGPDVSLVTSSEATANDVYRTLVNEDLLRDPTAPPPRHVFRATGETESFHRLARRFLGPEVQDVASI